MLHHPTNGIRVLPDPEMMKWIQLLRIPRFLYNSLGMQFDLLLSMRRKAGISEKFSDEGSLRIIWTREGEEKQILRGPSLHRHCWGRSPVPVLGQIPERSECTRRLKGRCSRGCPSQPNVSSTRMGGIE